MSQPVELTREVLRGMPLPQPEPDAGSKDARGGVLVVAGSRELPGAALLAATAVLRAGAGRLRVATGRSLALALGLAMPEAMVIGLPETARGGLRPGAGRLLTSRAAACQSLLIGPGLNGDAGTRDVLRTLLIAHPDKPVILDAGALADLGAHRSILEKRSAPVLLTPHAGEMARLLGRDRSAIEEDPLMAAREAAQAFRATVIMKGARTHVVSPQGEAWLHEGGHVGLATSGSGDVLAGILAGLLARGAEAAAAALWGVHLHGEAGCRLAEEEGPLGFLARDLPAQIPRLMTELH
jgi:hydroxyethylthiazole kinase-like uncharacterized protein yjeF